MTWFLINEVPWGRQFLRYDEADFPPLFGLYNEI